MKNLKYLLIFLVIFALVFSAGCFITPEDPEPEPEIDPGLPVGIIHSILIEPNNPMVAVGDSIVLTVHAYNFPGMEEVYIDGDKITWSDNCEEDVLDPLVGLSTVYTANGIYDVSNITACYEWPEVEGCPFPQYLCSGIKIDVVEEY